MEIKNSYKVLDLINAIIKWKIQINKLFWHKYLNK